MLGIQFLHPKSRFRVILWLKGQFQEGRSCSCLILRTGVDFKPPTELDFYYILFLIADL
jgi:hypothetical protein